MSSRHRAVDLWGQLKALAPYPPGVKAVPEMMAGLGFFPGGLGLIRGAGSLDLPRWPLRGVMILGHDFDTVAGYERSLKRGGESPRSPTWGTLTDLLGEAGVSLTDCFFTNVYIGLREHGKNSGPFPGRSDPDYVDRCLTFLDEQLAALRPRLLVVLGAPAVTLLAGRFDDLREWRGARTFADLDQREPVREQVALGAGHEAAVVSLVHPSYRRLNVKKRMYKGQVGHDAEVAMLRAAARAAGVVSP